MSGFCLSLSLLTLPTEIRLHIHRLCRAAEQKKLRLTSRKLNEEIIPILYERVYMDIFEIYMERLRLMANTAYIATAVRTLVVSSNLLSQCSLQDFENLLRCYIDIDSIAEELILERQWIKKCYQRYKSHRISQQLQIDKIGPVLKAFEGLRTLKIIWLYDVQASPYWQYLEHKIFSPKCVSLEAWSTGEVQGRSLAKYLWHSRLPDSLIALDYHYVPLYCWRIQEETPFWNSLQHLRLRIAHGETPADSELARLGLQRLLAATGLIKSLYLAADPCVTYLDRFDFSSVLLNVDSLTGLQDLTIETSAAEEENLVRVYKKYSGSLKRFNFYDIHLLKGYWQSIFDFFQISVPFCKFQLEGLTEGNGWYINTIVPFFKQKRIQ